MAYKFQKGLAILSGTISPEADDLFDLGAAAAQYKDIYIDGIAYIDQLGTDADPGSAYISGGELDNCIIGGETKAAGTFTTATVDVLTATANLDIGTFALKALTFESDQATGTAPFTVASTTVVTNLNASSLGGATMAEPGAIGGTTAAAVTATTLTATTFVMPTVTSGYLLVADGTDYEEVALSGDATLASGGAMTIANNAVSLAKMAGLTRGSVIIGDASGDPSALAKGAASTFLQSDGTDTAYVAMSGDATLSAGVISIGATKVTDAMINDDVATTLAGDGLSAASGIMALDLNELTAGVIAVATDSVAFIDSDGNGSKKESIADLVASMAGTGLTAVAGVLNSDAAGGTVTNLGDAAGTLIEGTNFSSANFTAARIWTLPASPTVGDVVVVKAPSNASLYALTVSRAGSQLIDGAATATLSSDYGSVSFVYMVSDVWGIK
jgi:hypothetical protein